MIKLGICAAAVFGAWCALGQFDLSFIVVKGIAAGAVGLFALAAIGD